MDTLKIIAVVAFDGEKFWVARSYELSWRLAVSHLATWMDIRIFQSDSSPHLARMRGKRKREERECASWGPSGNNGNARPVGSNLAFGKFILWIFVLHIFLTRTDSTFRLCYLLQVIFLRPNLPVFQVEMQLSKVTGSKFIRPEWTSWTFDWQVWTIQLHLPLPSNWLWWLSLGPFLPWNYSSICYKSPHEGARISNGCQAKTRAKDACNCNSN